MNEFENDFLNLLRSEGLNIDIELIETVNEKSSRVLILWANKHTNLVFNNWEDFDDYPNWTSERKSQFLRKILEFLQTRLKKKIQS